MSEQWTKWEPITGLANKYYIDAVLDSADGFIVFLSTDDESDKRVKVTFEDAVYAYRSTDDSLRRKIVAQLSDKYGKEFCEDWTFFKVNNSDYLKWLFEQSEEKPEFTDKLELKHFSFLGADFTLDVADNLEPKVEFIE